MELSNSKASVNRTDYDYLIKLLALGMKPIETLLIISNFQLFLFVQGMLELGRVVSI